MPRQQHKTHVLTLTALLVLLGLSMPTPGQAAALTGKIIKQQLNSERVGYTVMSLWGTHYEMGFAQGNLLADDIVMAVSEARKVFGEQLYPPARKLAAGMVWEPAEIEREIDGMLAGIKAARPTARIDAIDIKVLNTIGDWFYPPACNSHSAWGSFVKPPVKALHSRRLDTPLLLVSPSIKHHVLVARQASDGSKVRWVNVAWPGYVTSLTGVNEYGVQVSLHDLVGEMKAALEGGHMPRFVAARRVLTATEGVPLAQQLDHVLKVLSPYTIMSGGFINYYAPGGYGGVITCLAGKHCSSVRRPKAGFHNGEVLITTNFDTDGLTAPQWGEYIDAFYNKGGPKTLAEHFNVLKNGKPFSPVVHLLSVAYRGPGDMTLWFEGVVDNNGTFGPRLELEFADLFDRSNPASPVLALRPAAMDTSAAAEEGGCSFSGPAPLGLPLAGLVLLLLWLRLAAVRRRAEAR